MPLPPIDPPLLNSANPWCTTLSDLKALYASPNTGAVTTRTSLVSGFPHDPSKHQHVFLSPKTHSPTPSPDYHVSETYPTSLNTLGYSPIPLSTYLLWIQDIVSKAPPDAKKKPWIVSVTGTAEEITQSYIDVCALQQHLPTSPLAVEINLSCPNIPGKPPPAYSRQELSRYLDSLATVPHSIPLGLKTPPYTYAAQFEDFITALRDTDTIIDFLTATNTLGSCLVLQTPEKEDDGYGTPLLSSAAGNGIGGLAGESLHPLALGNVVTLRCLLDACPKLAGVDIIGVGGVSDAAGFARMRVVGAKVVGVGTALGREGIDVFAKILNSSG